MHRAMQSPPQYEKSVRAVTEQDEIHANPGQPYKRPPRPYGQDFAPLADQLGAHA
jgi:hypothetical protein